MSRGGFSENAAIAVAAAMLALAAAGCRKKVQPPPPPPPPPATAGIEPPSERPSPPRIESFAAEPSHIERGQTATLRWSISGDVSDVRIEPEVGPVAPGGSRQVSPERNTTYELLASGPGGSVRQTASVVVVRGPTAAPEPAARVTGTIQGSVTDSSGAAIAGAVVKASGNGGEATVTTDATGRFVFRNVPPGTYRVEVSVSGFAVKRIENVAVVPGQSMSLTAVMGVGATAPSTTASDRGPAPEQRPAGERLVIRIADIPPPSSATSGIAAEYRRLPVGAYRFELPELRQGEKSVARLVVDADPIQVRTSEEWEKAVAVPGNLEGRPTKISELMRATLTASEGVAVRALNQSEGGEERVFAGRLTKWNWELSPSSGGRQVISLDLRARIGSAYESVDPFPVVQEKTVAPAAVTTSAPGGVPTGDAGGSQQKRNGSVWLWVVGLLLAIAGISGIVLWRRRRTGRTAPVVAAGAPAPRLLVIHGMDERVEAERFCERLGVAGCEYVYGLSGYPVGSTQWQQEFSLRLAQADGVIVLLTADALGDQWVNWQVDAAVKQQAGRGTPIYPVILEEKVSRAASTLERLSAFAWLNGSREQDVDELKERVAAIHPAPTRLMKCFISYSRKTQQEIDTAVRLETDLEQIGYQCFRDLSDLRGGEEWERVIRSQLAEATHLLVLVTQSSAASRWVLKEILWAEGKRIIPLLKESVDLPEELRRYQGIPFSNYETGLTELLRTLRTYQPARKTGAA